MELILYVLFLGGWLLYSFRNNGLSPFSLLLLIYFISALCGFIVVNFTEIFSPLYHYSECAIFFNLLLIFIFFYPLQKIFSLNINEINQPNRSILLKISYICIAINIPTLISSLNYIYDLLMNYSMVLGDIRNAFYSGEILAGQKGFNIWDIAAATSLFSLVPFFYLLNYAEYKYLNVLLFISSLNIVVQNLRAMSRDAVVIWFFAFLSLYLIFRFNFNEVAKRRLKKVSLVVLGVLSIFILITLSRAIVAGFDSLNFFLEYLGQPFVYLTISLQELFNINNQLPHISSNVFKTFIGSLYSLYGVFETFGISLLFWFVANLYSRKRRKGSIDVYVFVLLYYFFSFGILYMHYFFTGRSTFGGMLIFVGMVYLITKKK